MTKRDQQSLGGCEPQGCRYDSGREHCRFSPVPTWLLFVYITFFIACSPIIIFVSIQIWHNTPKPPPDYVLRAIEWCADEGSLHDDIRANFTDPKLQDRNSGAGHPHPAHPDGLCKDLKTIIHQSVRYCEECGDDEGPDPTPPPEPVMTPPLVLGGEGVAIEISDNPDCAGDVITGITVDNTGNLPNPKRTFTGKDLDLPQFCPTSKDHTKGPDNNRRLNPALPQPTREWELLERPRVHHARTKPKPLIEDSDELIGGPYVVFIAKHLDGICCDGRSGAKALRDKQRVTVFVLYLDWVTEQPTIIEFDVEIERGKDIVSDEDTVQLISNVRLDSIDRQITFQVGQGARRIVIAGYDFSAESTTTDIGRRRRSEEDTSGSYRINLTDDGAVEQVYRLP